MHSIHNLIVLFFQRNTLIWFYPPIHALVCAAVSNICFFSEKTFVEKFGRHCSIQTVFSNLRSRGHPWRTNLLWALTSKASSRGHLTSFLLKMGHPWVGGFSFGLTFTSAYRKSSCRKIKRQRWKYFVLVVSWKTGVSLCALLSFVRDYEMRDSNWKWCFATWKWLNHTENRREV